MAVIPMPLMDPAKCFAKDYVDARKRFKKTVLGCAPEIGSYVNSRLGPNGEELATDVVWWGPKDAHNVLVMVSATHGPEGFCGSACQIDWLLHSRPENLPDGLAVLMLHAVNPYGFAWIHCETEEGVDLNRNWIDFSKPFPEDKGYDTLADALVPPDMSAVTLAKGDATLEAFRSEFGQRAFRAAIASGQYKHPNGMWYGGAAETWSRLTEEQVIRDFELPKRQLVTVIDYHSGAGPFGYGELFSSHRLDSHAAVRLKKWFGDSVTELHGDGITSVPEVGCCSDGWAAQIGDSLSYVYVEYGTYGFNFQLKGRRADLLLHAKGNIDWSDPETQRIKAMVRKHYYPDTVDWQEMILSRSRQILRQAISALS